MASDQRVEDGVRRQKTIAERCLLPRDKRLLLHKTRLITAFILTIHPFFFYLPEPPECKRTLGGVIAMAFWGFINLQRKMVWHLGNNQAKLTTSPPLTDFHLLDANTSQNRLFTGTLRSSHHFFFFCLDLPSKGDVSPFFQKMYRVFLSAWINNKAQGKANSSTTARCVYDSDRYGLECRAADTVFITLDVLLRTSKEQKI